MLYDERRACRVSTLNDTGDPADAAPWPSDAGDELVDIDPGSFAFHCDACNSHDITPRKGGGGSMTWAIVTPRDAWLRQALVARTPG